MKNMTIITDVSNPDNILLKIISDDSPRFRLLQVRISANNTIAVISRARL